MANEIILFDLPSRGKPACWSLNPWKARLVLNYKGLPYRTEWIEYPDVAPTFKSYGIPPNSPDVNPNAEYSIPAARIEGKYIMDSLAIARKIEEIKPEPSLHLDSEYINRLQGIMAQLMGPLAPIAMPRIPEMLLNPRSAKYFEETRSERFGMSLADLAKSEKAKNGLQNAQPALEELKALLNENSDSPFISGQEPSFADFILAGFWRLFELIDKDGDLFGRLMQFDGSFEKHYNVCKKFMEKDD